MADLIKRLEEATEGNLELSIAVGEHVGAKKRYEHWGSENPSHLRYTTSLDAALTLHDDVPKMVYSDPLKVCVDALRERAKNEEKVP